MSTTSGSSSSGSSGGDLQRRSIVLTPADRDDERRVWEFGADPYDQHLEWATVLGAACMRESEGDRENDWYAPYSCSVLYAQNSTL